MVTDLRVMFYVAKDPDATRSEQSKPTQQRRQGKESIFLQHPISVPSWRMLQTPSSLNILSAPLCYAVASSENDNDKLRSAPRGP
jgi:hypothetical protein